MRLADPRLQKLTNEFIEAFFKMAHDIRIEEGVGKHPATHSTKRDDSFEFNYTLAECIANSDEGIRQSKGDDYPLIGHGFPSNTVKGFFANAVIGIKDDVKFVIDNHKKQDEDLDYFVRDMHRWTETKSVKNVNIDFVMTGVGEPSIIEDELHDKYEFAIYNNKSGYRGLCTVLYVDGDFEELVLSGTAGKQLRINSREEPTIEHFKYTADINGFFMVLEQVKYGIQDVLKGE